MIKKSVLFVSALFVSMVIFNGTTRADNFKIIPWRTLAGKSNPDRHRGSVNCVAFSPDGRWLASGSDDKTVILWKIIRPGLEMNSKFSDVDFIDSEEQNEEQKPIDKETLKRLTKSMRELKI